jgi:hypothetical protein
MVLAAVLWCRSWGTELEGSFKLALGDVAGLYTPDGHRGVGISSTGSGASVGATLATPKLFLRSAAAFRGRAVDV